MKDYTRDYQGKKVGKINFWSNLFDIKDYTIYYLDIKEEENGEEKRIYQIVKEHESLSPSACGYYKLSTLLKHKNL